MSEGQKSSLAASASLGAGDSLWQACIDQLAQELPEQQFNTWIKPLAAQVSDDFSKVTVFVANRFKLDWIRAQYAGRIAAMLEKLYGQPVQLELALALREPASRVYATAANSEELVIRSPEDSAHRIRAVLGRKKEGLGAARDIVLANTAAALWVGGAVEDLKTGIVKAAGAIDSGAAEKTLAHLARLSHEPT